MADTTEFQTILTPIQPVTLHVSNTTLFELAAVYLGDATMWNFLVDLNPTLVNTDGFWDYDIGPSTSVTLPLGGQFVTNGGILNAFPAPVGSSVGEFNTDFDFFFA